MRKFFNEFKTFIAKGNVVDLAVAVVIGAAFNKIVSSLVNDVIMPLISLMVGGADVSDWKCVIRNAEYDNLGNLIVAESALKYGSFIQSIIDFLIIALTVFMIVKAFNFSKEKLNKISQTVIEESKKIKKVKKGKNKKGQMIEEPIQEVTETTIVPVSQPVVTESVNAETNEDMISILKEIRDNLKK